MVFQNTRPKMRSEILWLIGRKKVTNMGPQAHHFRNIGRRRKVFYFQFFDDISRAV